MRAVDRLPGDCHIGQHNAHRNFSCRLSCKIAKFWLSKVRLYTRVLSFLFFYFEILLCKCANRVLN